VRNSSRLLKRQPTARNAAPIWSAVLCVSKKHRHGTPFEIGGRDHPGACKGIFGARHGGLGKAHIVLLRGDQIFDHVRGGHDQRQVEIVVILTKMRQKAGQEMRLKLPGGWRY
jgi:hypothetical protein